MSGPTFGFGLSGDIATFANGITAGSYISVGPAPTSSTGLIRLPGGAQTDIAARNAANTADLTMLATDASNNLYIGTDSAFTAAKQYATLELYGSTGIAMGVTNSTYVQMAGGNFEHWAPVTGTGSGALPLRFLSTSFAIAGSAVTLSAAQYKCLFVIATGTPGADRTVIAPATLDGTWLFVNSSNNAQTFKTAAGTGISVATLKSAWLRADGTNIVRLTGDI
jgi:hypothetical protein